MQDDDENPHILRTEGTFLLDAAHKLTGVGQNPWQHNNASMSISKMDHVYVIKQIFHQQDLQGIFVPHYIKSLFHYR